MVTRQPRSCPSPLYRPLPFPSGLPTALHSLLGQQLYSAATTETRRTAGYFAAQVSACAVVFLN